MLAQICRTSTTPPLQFMKFFALSLALSIAFAAAEDKSPVFYQLDSNTPLYGKNFPNPNPSRPKFHEWFIDKEKAIADEKTAKRLMEIVSSEASYERNSSVLCFQPGMGFSVTRDGKACHYLICLHCHNMDVFIDGKQTESEVVLTKEAHRKLTALYEEITKENKPSPEKDDPKKLDEVPAAKEGEGKK